jgi:hypothetical protein
MSATDGATKAAQPSAQMKALDRLVGTWEVTGGAVGTVSYEWMSGGFFLLQRVDLTQNGQRITGLEVIGHLYNPFADASTFRRSPSTTSSGSGSTDLLFTTIRSRSYSELDPLAWSLRQRPPSKRRSPATRRHRPPTARQCPTGDRAGRVPARGARAKVASSGRRSPARERHARRRGRTGSRQASASAQSAPAVREEANTGEADSRRTPGAPSRARRQSPRR